MGPSLQTWSLEHDHVCMRLCAKKQEQTSRTEVGARLLQKSKTPRQVTSYHLERKSQDPLKNKDKMWTVNINLQVPSHESNPPEHRARAPHRDDRQHT